MALEIRELVVKVTVSDRPVPQGSLSPREQNALIEKCKRAVMKELDRKNKR